MKRLKLRSTYHITQQEFILKRMFTYFQLRIVFFSKGIESLQQTQIYNPYILQSDGLNLWYFTSIIWSNRIHSLYNLRSTTKSCKDIGIIKSEFKAQFLWLVTNYAKIISSPWNCKLNKKFDNQFSSTSSEKIVLNKDIFLSTCY